MHINTDEFPEKYRAILHKTEELVRVHMEWFRILEVMLKHHPEVGGRTDSLDVILEEIFTRRP